MLEMRILYKFLPSNFDHLENFNSPVNYLPLISQQKAIEVKHKNYKVVQEAKRQWLHIFLSDYEIKLQEYDQEYQQILKELESLLLNNTSINGTSLFDDINRYMTYRTNQLKQDILQKMSIFQGKLLRNRHRSSSTKDKVGVSPEPYLDLHFNPFTTHEWQYLSLGKNFSLSSIISFL